MGNQVRKRRSDDRRGDLHQQLRSARDEDGRPLYNSNGERIYDLDFEIAHERRRLDDDKRRLDNREVLAKYRAGQFVKGQAKVGGRKAGTPNKLTSILRDGVEAAAAAAGYVDIDDRGRHTPTALGGVEGYLLSLAVNHPNIFGRLMGMLIMHEMNGKFTGTLNITQKNVFTNSTEVLEAMLARGMVIPPSLKELPQMKEVKQRMLDKRVADA